MTDPLHMQQSDDDEEDLERLRLEALKTIHNKAEIIQKPSHDCSPLNSQSIQTSGSYKLLQQYPSTNTFPNTTLLNEKINNQNVYYPSIVQLNHDLSMNRSLANDINSYDTRQKFERININEPYMPQNISNSNSSDLTLLGGKNWSTEPSIIGSSYVPYSSHKIIENMTGVTNVQLSPRSMAFVAENNDILMRRKNEKSNYARSPSISPNYRESINHSPSPVYRPFIKRWSRSPSSKSKSRSPLFHDRNYTPGVHRRSSPRTSLAKSPDFRRKTLSKSPPRSAHHSPSPRGHYRKSKSPSLKNFKCGKSRSPLTYTRYKSSRRRTSRSPNSFDRRRRSASRSPLLNVNGRRSPQDSRQHTYHSRSSGCPRTSNIKDSTSKYNIRKSRSPVSPSLNNHRRNSPPRPKSKSRSPVKRYNKYTRENNIHNRKRRSDGGISNNLKSRNRKRSCSPANKRKHTRMNTPERARLDNMNRFRKFDRDRNKAEENNKRNPQQNEKYKNIGKRGFSNVLIDGQSNSEKNRNKDDKATDKADYKVQKVEHKLTNDKKGNSFIMDKSEMKVEEKNVIKTDEIDSVNQQKEISLNKDKNECSKDDECSSNENDNGDDGIDLFASDESESENEGRFKLNSSKNKRDIQMSTLSFSKLNEISTSVIVKDLREIDISTNRNDLSKNNRDKNKSNSSDFDKKRRDDRFKRSSDTDRSRCSTYNERRRNNKLNSTNTNSQKRKDRNETLKVEEEKSKNKPTFKSTFTVVENEGSTENDTKPSETVNSTLDTNTISSSSSSSVSGKKPIHLRLGAMTNTFKAHKNLPNNWTLSSSTSSEKKAVDIH